MNRRTVVRARKRGQARHVTSGRPVEGGAAWRTGLYEPAEKAMRLYIACRTVMPEGIRLYTRETYGVNGKIACVAYYDGEIELGQFHVEVSKVGPNGPDMQECSEGARALLKQWGEHMQWVHARCAECQMPIRVRFGFGGKVLKIAAPCGHPEMPS